MEILQPLWSHITLIIAQYSLEGISCDFHSFIAINIFKNKKMNIHFMPIKFSDRIYMTMQLRFLKLGTVLTYAFIKWCFLFILFFSFDWNHERDQISKRFVYFFYAGPILKNLLLRFVVSMYVQFPCLYWLSENDLNKGLNEHFQAFISALFHKH